MTALLRVLDTGASITVQDIGRPGYQRFGIAEGGAMDRFALAEGAVLLGQSDTLAALEMAFTGGGFCVEGDQAVTVATSGARMDLVVDGKPLPWRSTFVLIPGQELRIGHARDGVYGYLHVSGGFEEPVVLGSRSTHTRAGFGGHRGRRLCEGDRLVIGKQAAGRLPQRLDNPSYFNRNVIRVVWGAQAHQFSDATRDLFLRAPFRMSTRRDRMGARLETSVGSLAASGGLSGISDAVVAGDVQISGDGTPTVLLSDRQPTGGYPRIATIISADLAAIAQLPASAEFRFELTDMSTSIEALATLHAVMNSLPSQLQPLIRDPADMADLLSYNLIDGVVAAAQAQE